MLEKQQDTTQETTTKTQPPPIVNNEIIVIDNNIPHSNTNNHKELPIQSQIQYQTQNQLPYDEVNHNENQINNSLDKPFNEEFENESPSDFNINKSIRLGFIRKVYSLLLIQLILTCLISSLAFIPDVGHFYRNNLWPLFVAAPGLILISFTIICFPDTARKVPMNYICLFSFTFFESILLSYVFSFVTDFKIVIIAASITIIITATLTLYACFTKTDFTFLGGMLFACSIGLLVCGLFYFYLPNFLKLLYCFIGVVLYSLYLIYDTQLIAGKFEYGYSVDDYVFAVLNLYIDIMQIFLYILRILGGR